MTDAKPPGRDRAAAGLDDDTAANPLTIGRRAARVAECRAPREHTYPELPQTDRQLDAVVETAEHLRRLDLPPIFRPDTVRALWRRERDCELACELARLAGIA